MKTVFRVIVVALLSGVVFAVNTTTHAKTITVAYPSPSWNTSLPVSTARDFGIFAAEGLDVRPVYVRGGPVVMAALLSGEADYAIMAGGYIDSRPRLEEIFASLMGG